MQMRRPKRLEARRRLQARSNTALYRLTLAVPPLLHFITLMHRRQQQAGSISATSRGRQ